MQKTLFYLRKWCNGNSNKFIKNTALLSNKIDWFAITTKQVFSMYASCTASIHIHTIHKHRITTLIMRDDPIHLHKNLISVSIHELNFGNILPLFKMACSPYIFLINMFWEDMLEMYWSWLLPCEAYLEKAFNSKTFQDVFLMMKN